MAFWWTALVLIMPVIAIILCIKLGNNKISDSTKKAVIKVFLLIVKLGNTNFQNADLIEADFTKSNLIFTDFRGANLTRTRFYLVKGLYFSRLGDSILNQDLVKDLLVKGNGTNKSYVRANLKGANLVAMDLRRANFRGADLSEADLSEADLEWANLTETNATNTNFTSARLTGVCLEAWSIDKKTIFENVNCKFVFLLEKFNNKGDRQRFPEDFDKNFELEEFKGFCQQFINTIQIVLRDGANKKAFRLAYEQVLNSRKEVTFNSIQEIGEESDDFLLKFEIPENLDKIKFERQFMTIYKAQLLKSTKSKMLETRHAEDLKEIIFALIEKEKNHTNNIQIEVQAVAENQSKSETYNQTGNFGIGHMSGGTIEESAEVAGVINKAQPKNLAEVANEIQDLLDYFEQNNPTITEAQQIVKTATERQPELKNAKMIEEAIKVNPSLKQRLKAVGATAYVETVKMLLPPVGVAIEAVKAWNNP